jgi:hypothetical protein
MRRHIPWIPVFVSVGTVANVLAEQPLERPIIDVTADLGRVKFMIDGRPVATYVYDEQYGRRGSLFSDRPYFAHVRARSGIQVTRNHPPIPGVDSTDHATPGN